MNFNQTCTDIFWRCKNNGLDFGDIIFKDTGGQTMLRNAVSALYLLNGWLDFNGICTDKSLGDGKELFRFR